MPEVGANDANLYSFQTVLRLRSGDERNQQFMF